MKATLLCLLLITLLSPMAQAMNVGFNQAWFKNDYGHQYLDRSYDRDEVIRIFKLASLAGSKDLRLWFFESPKFPMLKWENNKIVGIKPEFIKNVVDTLKIARSFNMTIYMTLLDAQAYRPDQLDAKTLRNLRAIYQHEGGENFLDKAVGPLLDEIEHQGLSPVISKIDIANEVDAVFFLFGFDLGWKGAQQMLCQWRNFIKSYKTFNNKPVSFSLRLQALVPIPKETLRGASILSCGDFLDFHSYENDGHIFGCQELLAYAKQNKKPIILGEFGQAYFNNSYNDQLHVTNTTQYLASAKKCGFSQALAWRLSDVRPGHNPEARYSFEAYGEPRPSFKVIQDHNLNNP